MTRTRSVTLILLCAAAHAAQAATLHGRVKDRQCAVLSRIAVEIRTSGAAKAALAVPALLTDEGGNYTVVLPAGTYDVCMKQGTAAAVCTAIEMPTAGDKWVTTQLRDAAPDLSHLGNQAY